MRGDVEGARHAAVTAYQVARAVGKAREAAAQAAWMAARRVLRYLRAPRWSSQVWTNTGCRRSYASPLGSVLGCVDYVFGGHSAKWPRTRASYRAEEQAEQAVLDWLDAQPGVITLCDVIGAIEVST